MTVNQAWYKLLDDTQDIVWKNYKLISTQWENPQSETLPPYVANTTMETYIQEPDPDTMAVALQNGTSLPEPSSCIACHKIGATLNGNAADFSFLFSKAARKIAQQSSSIANK